MNDYACDIREWFIFTAGAPPPSLLTPEPPPPRSIRDIVRHERTARRARGFGFLAGWPLDHSGDTLWPYIMTPPTCGAGPGLTTPERADWAREAMLRARAGYQAAWARECEVDLTGRCGADGAAR